MTEEPPKNESGKRLISGFISTIGSAPLPYLRHKKSKKADYPGT